MSSVIFGRRVLIENSIKTVRTFDAQFLNDRVEGMDEKTDQLDPDDREDR
jgi:hypothetical protein